MVISLSDHEGIRLDVQATRDRISIRINDRVLWLTPAEAEALRRELAVVSRALDVPPLTVHLPAPRSC